MNGKMYKIVSHAGAENLTLGIIAIVTGIVTGILLLTSGARLLKSKREMTF